MYVCLSACVIRFNEPDRRTKYSYSKRVQSQRSNREFDSICKCKMTSSFDLMSTANSVDPCRSDCALILCTWLAHPHWSMLALRALEDQHMLILYIQEEEIKAARARYELTAGAGTCRAAKKP
jgi:hypothetical protein